MMCDFCDEREGTERIANPNVNLSENVDWKDEANWWVVCKECKQFIHKSIVECIETVE